MSEQTTIDAIKSLPFSIYAVGKATRTAGNNMEVMLQHGVCYKFVRPHAYIGCYAYATVRKQYRFGKFYASVPDPVNKLSEITFMKDDDLQNEEFAVLSLFHCGSSTEANHPLDLKPVLTDILQQARTRLDSMLVKTRSGEFIIKGDGIPPTSTSDRAIKYLVECPNERAAQMLLECAGLSKKELRIEPATPCPCCGEDLGASPENCAICGKRVCENCIAECIHCSKHVCESCRVTEGAFAMNSGITLCETCQDDLPCCDLCGQHSGADGFIIECGTCGQMVCEFCRQGHKAECADQNEKTAKSDPTA